MQISRLDRMFLFFAVVFTAVMAGAGYYLQVSMKDRLTRHIEHDGMVVARTIARSLPETTPARGLDDFCAAYRNDTQLRVTVIDRDGNVLGESQRSAKGMENHGDRPEIRQALSAGTGWSIRHSDTLDEDMLYVAVQGPYGRRVVRVAMPLARLRGTQNEIMLAASVFFYLLPFLAAAMLFFIARHLKQTKRERA